MGHDLDRMRACEGYLNIKTVVPTVWIHLITSAMEEIVREE
jgi:hypothetical protein